MNTEQTPPVPTRFVWQRAFTPWSPAYSRAVWRRAFIWCIAQILFGSLIWILSEKLDQYAFARFLLASNIAGFFIASAIILFPRKTN